MGSPKADVTLPPQSPGVHNLGSGGVDALDREVNKDTTAQLNQAAYRP